MIEAVIFDVGGVLLRTSDRTGRLLWEQRLGLAEWESEEIVFNSEIGTRAQLGLISDAELWSWVGRRLAFNERQLSEFRDDFWSGDRIDTQLVGYIRKLRPQYQSAIISNATDALRENLTSEYEISDAFDLIVVSAEEGIMKPDAAIYQRTLQRLGRTAQEAVFVDDSLDNVLTAREIGMQGIHFNAAMDIPKELEKLGVAVPS